ncbi:hypothetical protein DH2020_035476 [Rehmannia glutinosa]|uniref:Uncharacterized protein n=1 Tax=Rehmannia glutinosa TaxID=99300 RepID=A0ABR0V884_REHGL
MALYTPRKLARKFTALKKNSGKILTKTHSPSPKTKRKLQVDRFIGRELESIPVDTITKRLNVDGSLTSDMLLDSMAVSRVDQLKITIEMASILIQPFTEDEVSSALKHMHLFKSPILDDDTLLFGQATLHASFLLFDVQLYEKISGPIVNVEKSRVFFIPNTPADSCQSITLLLHIPEVERHGKYLGLPMIIGNNKHQIFTSIIDRVWTRLKVGKRINYDKRVASFSFSLSHLRCRVSCLRN